MRRLRKLRRVAGRPNAPLGRGRRKAIPRTRPPTVVGHNAAGVHPGAAFPRAAPPVNDQPQFEFGTGFDRNAALLSSHWLDRRLPREPEFDALADPADAVLERLAALWAKEGRTLPGLGEQAMEHRFVQPVFEALGWEASYQTFLEGRKPDYALFRTRDAYDAALAAGTDRPGFWSPAAVVADAKAWGKSLDKPAGRGAKREYPPEQIEDYLTRSRCPFGILTNGRLWRLVPRDREPWQPRFATYYQFDLAAFLTEWNARGGGDDGLLLLDETELALREAFRRFVLFFGPAGHADGPDWSLVARAVAGSTAYRQGIGEDMRDRAFDALRLCVEGFLAEPDTDLDPAADLAESRDASFVLIYRLLFAMFAEDRGLLPLGRNATSIRRTGRCGTCGGRSPRFSTPPPGPTPTATPATGSPCGGRWRSCST